MYSIISAASFFLWIVSCGALMVLWAFAIGLLGNLISPSLSRENIFQLSVYVLCL